MVSERDRLPCGINLTPTLLHPFPSASLDISITRVRKVVVLTSGLFPPLFLLLMSAAAQQGASFSLTLIIFIASLIFDGVHTSGIPLNPSDLMPAYAGALYGAANTIGTIPGVLSFWEGRGQSHMTYAVN